MIIGLGALFLGTVLLLRLTRNRYPQQLSPRAGTGGPIVASAAFAVAQNALG